MTTSVSPTTSPTTTPTAVPTSTPSVTPTTIHPTTMHPVTTNPTTYAPSTSVPSTQAPTWPSPPPPSSSISASPTKPTTSDRVCHSWELRWNNGSVLSGLLECDMHSYPVRYRHEEYVVGHHGRAHLAVVDGAV
ncbi:hypothetical protein CYMTET_47971 [Cymbomonas tetramitiformis]|uniref:Uncharacterized protein n=1 Tax=Cymbomonas tetramitiformis TaxID=36881 RepID=A0AAE0BV54_9CHLO|nr:hypothetical protein CYMTET_47971 [Cymbomonas tetramitiformis]